MVSAPLLPWRVFRTPKRGHTDAEYEDAWAANPRVGRFAVRRTSGEDLGMMEPSRRSFPARNMATTEAALMTRGVSQLYVSLGDPDANGAVPVRLYFKPNVLLIWGGAFIMFLGGGLSLSDRRLRIGAPRPAKAKTVLVPAESVVVGLTIGALIPFCVEWLELYLSVDDPGGAVPVQPAAIGGQEDRSFAALADG